METRTLPNLSRYLIREDGNVQVKELTLPHNKGGTRTVPSKWLKGQIDKKGYKVYHLVQDDKKVRVYKAHRLVCLCWYPDNQKETVNHKDGNKLNNHYSNLEWATWKENTQHSFAAGLNGEHCYSDEAKEKRRQNGVAFMKKRRKLSLETAALIKQRVLNGEKQITLATEYNVAKSVICNICKGNSYNEN